MIRAEIVELNKELLKKMKTVGIRMDDYKYCNLFRDYIEMSQTADNRKVVILTLAERYGISDRQVYNIVRHMEHSVKLL